MPGYELIGESELEEIKLIFSNGGILFRQGFENLRNNCYKVKDFENQFTQKLDSKHSLAVTSGTAALRVALAALNIGPGDEVITSSFTFVATVEAIIESGAIPKCVNIDETLNIDPQDLRNNISSNTKAVIAIHMLGTPARLNEINAICKSKNLFLIEDTAWGCGGKLDNKYLGTWGDIGTFSFDFAKTITTGEGGMITFKNKKLFEKAKAWHDHGHENNPDFPRWEDTRSGSGFNYRMNELQGAIGIAQLGKLDYIVESQRKNKDKIIKKISQIEGINLRQTPPNSYETADALIFFVKDSNLAKKCREELLLKGIGTKILPEAYTWHFASTWTHMPELMNAHKGQIQERLKQSQEILQKCVSIPINVKMPDDIPNKINDALEFAIMDSTI